MIDILREIVIETAFPNVIKNEAYWRKIIASVPQRQQREYLQGILNTIMRAQHGRASDRQMQLLRRAAAGDTSAWHTKN